jgi:hypothetical protein
VDAAFMQLQRHERGIHALWFGAGGARLANTRFHVRARQPRRQRLTRKMRLTGKTWLMVLL